MRLRALTQAQLFVVLAADVLVRVPIPAEPGLPSSCEGVGVAAF